ncbi:MAG TPA: SRPBCC family protein [Candidatus Bathyarchaeia archaeon]|jgi:uncharacterized protein YndB with AHSA1/START domain|nr:SRPBCC family protein [Candidatus Bathyarchaeia archaeon]
MINVETSVLIDQPIEKVFEFVTTPENDEQWLIGVKAKKTSTEPTKVGATSETEIRFLGQSIKTTFEVTKYEPPGKIEIKTISGPVDMKAVETFESVAEGQTKVTVRGEAHARGFFKLAEPIVERMAQRQWESSYENLKDVLEAH